MPSVLVSDVILEELQVMPIEYGSTFKLTGLTKLPWQCIY